MVREKPKKIGIRHFLKKTLFSKDKIGSRPSNFHPVYTSITYQRQNTQLSSRTYVYAEDINKVSKEERAELLNEEINIRKIIEFKHKIEGKDFKLSAIKKDIDFYSNEIVNILEHMLRVKLSDAIFCLDKNHAVYSEIITNSLDKEIDFDLIYNASVKLIGPSITKNLSNNYKRFIKHYPVLKTILKKYSQKKDRVASTIFWIDGDLKEFIIEEFNKMNLPSGTGKFMVEMTNGIFENVQIGKMLTNS